MPLDWTTVISTFIGAFLAASTGYFFELRRENARMKQAHHLLKVVIIDDLRYAVTLYDKAIDEWDKTKTVWFSTLNEIRESRFAYQNNKDWIHVFEDSELRRRIFRYYLQSSERVTSLENQQRRKYEIEGRLNDVVRDIKQKDSSLSHENAVKVAVSYMQSESGEYDNLQKFISESIGKLSEFKREAQEIAKILENSK